MLENRIAKLEERVARLEAGQRSARPREREPQSPMEVLEHLQSKTGEDYARDGRSGAVTYAGAARLNDRDYLWVREHAVPDLAEADWTTAARLLECLGSPSRLALLTALLDEPRTSRQLQESLGETSTGHLYHHLRDLQATGLLVQRRRGTYELAPHTVVPLLAIMAVALDLGAGTGVETEVGK
ncbi:ArsR/SmtB family transcription factor [Streptosporangium saharense]|uniref:ArsR/SmtB family transcription factor n=1 Tax=Streptosporangium saharense TaxID=1706840 RepID=UPI003326AB18